MDGLNSFGRLLRRLRGKTPLAAIAQAAALDPAHLAQMEAAQVPVDRTIARHILKEGFALKKPDIDRLILGIQLYDLGLKDNDSRQLVIAVIRKELPPAARSELKQLCQRYANDTA